ncbi:hypothetical protein GY31_04930 [Lysinibacillus sphaericus]|nr:hypothetical protein GY31_04930 [Lysinibacillus sphaericus]
MRDNLKISYIHQDEKSNIAVFFHFFGEGAILETTNTSIKMLVEDTFQREEIITKYSKSKHNSVRRGWDQEKKC